MDFRGLGGVLGVFKGLRFSFTGKMDRSGASAASGSRTLRDVRTVLENFNSKITYYNTIY